jgi:ISXO2 transposase-like protein
VEAGSALYSDALKSYAGLPQGYAHGVIEHAEKYVDGRVHTNGLGDFWLLLKRSIHGSYVSVEPFHLSRYLDEQSFRFNNLWSAITRSRSSCGLSPSIFMMQTAENRFGNHL